MSPGLLPYVDTHSLVVSAAPEDLWRSVLRATDRFTGKGNPWITRILGTEPPSGFDVVVETAGHSVLLTGRHRFSIYELRFLVESAPGGTGTVLSAVTHAAFPGPSGRVYRILVVGTGFHSIVTRRTLASMARACAPGSGPK